jgi:hypothetical protein
MAGSGDMAEGESPGQDHGRGRGRVRASRADREQVVSALQAAFVQGRLTQDELSERTGQVYSSRTYAELAEVIADVPTPLTGTQRPRRPPWRATKRAWWFEYAVLVPGVVALIVLPGGPHTTRVTFAVFAAVAYLVFWSLGALTMIASRNPKTGPAQQIGVLPWYEREQAASTLKAALAQGRLTQDEHDERAAEVHTAKLDGELAALTADLPADLAARLPKARHAWAGAAVSLAAATLIVTMVLVGPDNFGAFAILILCAVVVLLLPPVTVGMAVDARHQRRLRRQLRLGPTP